MSEQASEFHKVHPGLDLTDDDLIEAWRRHRQEMRALAVAAPALYVRFDSHQLSVGPTSKGAVFAYHFLLPDLVRELINSLNGWQHDLLRLRAWTAVLERYEDQQRLELREEFIGATAEVLLSTPYRMKQALTFTAYKALEFCLPDSQPSLEDWKIEKSSLEQIVADRKTGITILTGLETLNTEIFRTETRNFRNMYHHHIAPGIVLGERATVTRIADERGTGFGFGGMSALSLGDFLPPLQAEHVRAVVVFEQLWALVREIERELEAG
jgi:hypothetical protein